MPLATQTAPTGSGAGVWPPGVFLSGRRYEPGARAFAESPLPFQIAATRSRSVSNAAQQPLPRLSTNARGLRLSARPSPAARASTTEEKKGKSGSTQSAQRGDAAVEACGGSITTEEARGGTATASSSAARSAAMRHVRSCMRRFTGPPHSESRAYFLPMQIGIIGGTGHEGRGIAARFAAAGLSVLIGSRDAGRARETVDRLHGASSTLPVEGVANDKVAARSDVVFLAVPFDGLAELLATLRGHLRPGTLVVDLIVPLTFEDGVPDLVRVPEGS